MTVSYALDVSRNSWFNAFKILFRWRGSIWRLIWKELFLWLFTYYAVMIFYRSEWILTPDGQRVFERLAHHIGKRIDWIPLTFILAFFVNIVFSRWTRIIDNMGYIENSALTVAMTVRGAEENDIVSRRAMVRYLCLAQVLVFRDISVKVRRRFPNLDSIVQAGYLEEDEKILFETVDSEQHPNKYWLPINWACSLAFRLRDTNNVKSEPALMQILVEFKNFRTNLQTLCNFDWVPVPVAYPQVVYFAVTIYFLLALVGRQFIIGNEAENKAVLDIVFPFMTVLQFVFYVGWMKVAESLLNPMGEDDDHFECNSLIDKNISTALAIVDDTFDQVPNLKMDRFKNQKDPLYAENSVPKGPHGPQFTGSAAHLVLAPKDEPVHMVPVKSEPVIEEVVDASNGGIMNFPNSMRRRIRRLSQSRSANFPSTFTKSRRSESLAAIDNYDSKKNSIPTKETGFSATINGRLPTETTDFGNSFDYDSINSPFSATQSTVSGFNYSMPVSATEPRNIHHHPHHRADHIKRAPVLDEIVEEESAGGLSREASAHVSLGDSQPSVQYPIALGGSPGQISPIPEEESESRAATQAPSATFNLSSPHSSSEVINEEPTERPAETNLDTVATFTISPPMSPQPNDETVLRRPQSLPSRPPTDRPSHV